MSSHHAWFLFGCATLIAACSSGTPDSQQQASEGGAGTGSMGGGGSGMGSSGTTSGMAGSGAGSGATDAATLDSTARDSTIEAGDAGEDGASQTTGSDADATCATCGAGSVCVENQTIGGAVFRPDDAGQCPAGRIIVPAAPNFCSLPPTFNCALLPSACATAPGSTAVAHCTCAPSLCSAGRQCTDLTPTLMRCLLSAP